MSSSSVFKFHFRASKMSASKPQRTGVDRRPWVAHSFYGMWEEDMCQMRECDKQIDKPIPPRIHHISCGLKSVFQCRPQSFTKICQVAVQFHLIPLCYSTTAPMSRKRVTPTNERCLSVLGLRKLGRLPRRKRRRPRRKRRRPRKSGK